MIYIAVVGVYLAFLVSVSLYRSRQVKTQDDFMVAGRSVPWYFLVGTLVCTWIGSGSLFAGAGRGFREGFSALWMSAGAWVGIAIVYFLAGRVRRIAQYTVPDILETRYHPAARLLGTIAIVIAYLTIAGYQFIGGGRLLNILFPAVDPDAGKAIICGLVILFTITAGMLSIVSLDVFNGLIIIVSIAIAAPLALSGAGGWSTLTETLPATHFTVTGRLGISAAMGLFLPTLFLLLGESSMYQKFFAAKDESAARKAVIGMIIGGHHRRDAPRHDRDLRRGELLERHGVPRCGRHFPIPEQPRRPCSCWRAMIFRRSRAVCCSRERSRSSSPRRRPSSWSRPRTSPETSTSASSIRTWASTP